MFILGLILGTVLGVLILDIALEEEKENNKILEKEKSNLEDDLDSANFRVEQRDRFLSDYQEEHEILVKEISELKSKVTDLENNIELLTNNSEDKKIKELITDDQSNN